MTLPVSEAVVRAPLTAGPILGGAVRSTAPGRVDLPSERPLPLLLRRRKRAQAPVGKGRGQCERKSSHGDKNSLLWPNQFNLGHYFTPLPAGPVIARAQPAL